MSLTRLCALSQCLSPHRRRVFQRCTTAVGDCWYCRQTHWLQRRHFSPLFPKAEERVVKQSQLLDVLEARIQQLQPNGMLDVQHAEVHVLKAPASGKGSPSGKPPKSNTSHEKGDAPKQITTPTKGAAKGQSSKSGPSRWLEKLSKERTKKIEKAQTVQQKLWKNVKEKPQKKVKEKLQTKVKEEEQMKVAGKLQQNVKEEPRKNLKEKPATKLQGGLAMKPAQSHKTISSSAAKLRTSSSAAKSSGSKWAEKIRSAQASASAAAAAAAAVSHTVSKKKGREQAQGKPGQVAEVEAVARRSLQVQSVSGGGASSSSSSSSGPEHLLRDREQDIQFSLHSYLEACVFSGDVERANGFLLGQHRILNRRKLLNIGMYNIVMRIWAKKGKVHDVGGVFKLVEEAGLKLDLGSYCAALECLKRMEEEGLSVDQLFRQFVFRQDERDMVVAAVRAAWPDYQPAAHGDDNSAERHSALVQDFYLQWRKTLLQALKDRKKTMANTRQRDYRLDLYPYLRLLDDSEYVDIMIQGVSSLPLRGESLSTLAKDMGHKVYTKACICQKGQNRTVDKLAAIYAGYTGLLAKDTPEWPYVVEVELGTYLVELMVKHLKIDSDVLQPAAQERKRIPILYHIQIQLGATETHLTFDASVMPMLCPPVPWVSSKYGAYLLSPTKLMRSVDGATQHENLLEGCHSLHPVLDSLNLLGSCTWRVNTALLDIIVAIFNDRGSVKLGVPPPLTEAPRVPHFITNDPAISAVQKAQMKREAVLAKKQYGEMHSLRMDALYKLSIANHMRDKQFWFPHNMDFRGRTYPCPPHFNHLGSDVTRALLVFAEGKPLGPKGLDWLKVHLVNLTGLKKRSSLEGRLEYANSIMEDGRKWWMDADEPWQALGCCKEIAAAVRSPDPAQFISHLPVQQDGSCNGLQHYAALGRDVIGATSVNLMPCDVPQDVYSGVAQQVEEFRARDAARGVTIAQVLKGYISRKVVKQTVMTVVYGVTRYGGRLQIEKRLKEIDEFPQVFSGLKEMFTGTREIQDWLTDSARLISKSGRTVEWVTPLGLPVKQDIQDINLKISNDEAGYGEAEERFRRPNFIHSLDSTHMMLTSLNCYSAGLTFVSVHDCFWTHAVTVDTMNKVCREQFVALHSQPILQELSNFLLQKYCHEQPEEGTSKK
ncbi:hypothetical protein CRUP_013148, partial [Coryphaenoides rupestris]